MEHFSGTDYIAKKPRSLQSTILKKSRKIAQKLAFIKNGHFWWFFLIFSKMGPHRELKFFCVVISASKRFISAIK